MPKKRKSADRDKQTNAGSAPLVKKDDKAKRIKLGSTSDTELQDLPIALFECILVKVVVMEVKDLKLAKSVWEKKADGVVKRLKTVSSQWNDILTTNSFQNKLQRTLDGTAQEKISLEILHQYPIKLNIRAITAMKDELFMLHRECQQKYEIQIYDRSDVNKAKSTIQLPSGEPMFMRACSVSNSLYVGMRGKSGHSLKVLRISNNAGHQGLCLKDCRQPISVMSVSADGNLLLLSLPEEEDDEDVDVLSIYSANRSLLREQQLCSELNGLHYYDLLQKSNGNLVLACVNDYNQKTNLVEIDANGNIVRHYESALNEVSFVNFANINGRIMLAKPYEGIELLDSELNRLCVYSLKEDEGKNLFVYDLHYESERDEMMRIHYDRNTETSVLTIFCFKE